MFISSDDAKTNPIQSQFKANQTQFKPNSNPIQTQFMPQVSNPGIVINISDAHNVIFAIYTCLFADFV